MQELLTWYTDISWRQHCQNPPRHKAVVALKQRAGSSTEYQTQHHNWPPDTFFLSTWWSVQLLHVCFWHGHSSLCKCVCVYVCVCVCVYIICGVGEREEGRYIVIMSSGSQTLMAAQGRGSGGKSCLEVSWALKYSCRCWWGKERHFRQPAFEFY